MPTKVQRSTQDAFHGPISGHNHSTLTAVLLPYYVFIHFWMLVSGNIAWVRALSLLAFFGTIIAIGWMGLRIAGRWCGIIASVLTATSAILVEKSLNARPV